MMKETDYRPLLNCMRRAMNGEPLTVGFFGGSITQDSLASVHENCYAYRTYQWWCRTFPKAEIHYVNAGIGGTDSLYGVSRVHDDMLMYMPDVIFVDFSVNDEPNDFFMETYEGLIRRMLSCPSHPAVVLLHNAFYDSGKTAEPQHGRVGDYYHLPRVSIKDTVYQRLLAGEFQLHDISPDGLHPNDRGHKLVADELIKMLDQVYAMLQNPVTNQEASTDLPAPLTANAWQKAVRLTIRNCEPTCSGFLVDPREKMGHLDHFKNGWIGLHAGDAITFSVSAACIAVQYRKTVRHPARRARLILDGDTEHAVLLDGNFTETWGDCLYLQTVLYGNETMTHTVRLEILMEEDESVSYTPFYLMSLITA